MGCGRIAQLVHLNLLTRLPGAELVALAEPNLEQRERASQRAPGAVVFTDYKELLEMPEVEAVVICLPNALHAQAAVAAMERGKHVYLEKPLASGLSEARRVLAAWRRADVIGMIGFNLRFNALYQAVRQQIRLGSQGELVGARSVFSTAVRTLPTWKQTRGSGGGALLDLASHHVDLVHFLFGQDVREVFAGLRSQRSEGDTVMLQLRLADGLLIQSFFSMSAVEEERFEVYGQGGKLAVDRYLSLDVEITGPTRDLSRLKQLRRGLRALVHSSYRLDKILAPSREPSYQAALTHFVAAARGNQPASPNFWDGYRSLAIIEAAEESARTGAVVSLRDLAYEDLAR